jgi:hypothetical protein
VFRSGRRKPKWQENPPPLKACRFDSDLGHISRTGLRSGAPNSAESIRRSLRRDDLHRPHVRLIPRHVERALAPMDASEVLEKVRNAVARIGKKIAESLSAAALAFAALLSVVAGCYNLATRSETPLENDQGASCDVSLWAHVYHGRFPSAEDRLQVINPCLTVSGIIVNARQEKDGDWHVRVDLDAEYGFLLNQANLEKQYGYLVLEPICSNPVSQSDTLAEGVCDGFSQAIFTTDLIGKRVAATGAYVIDRQHGWMELHPVTSIVPIP